MRPFANGALAGAGLAIIAGLGVTALAAVTPSNDYLFLPSPARPVAPVVSVQGETADPPAGGPGFLYTAIVSRHATRLEAWLPFVRDDDSELVPSHLLVPEGSSETEQDAIDKAAMTDSQKTAAAVAERALGLAVRISTDGVRVNDTALADGSPAREAGLRSGDVITEVSAVPVETLAGLRQILLAKRPGDIVPVAYRRGTEALTTSVRLRRAPDDAKRAILGISAQDEVTIDLAKTVKFEIGAVEGPSAGLVFALEIYSALSDRRLAGDHRVAVTGSIEIGGQVGPIGGVAQKVIGAAEAGADILIVPRENEDDARAAAPPGLRVIAVTTFDEALTALGDLAAK